MRRRLVQHLEFSGGDRGGALDAMRRLSAARDGWINFLPGVPEEEVDEPPAGLFNALFGTAQPPVSMCTWLPASTARRHGEETVGVMHARGRFALRQLSSMGVPLPPGWRVRQDHGKRGLIVHPPAGAPHDAVLDWLLCAGAALAMMPLTGTWQARVYLPRDAVPPGSGEPGEPPEPDRSTTS